MAGWYGMPRPFGCHKKVYLNAAYLFQVSFVIGIAKLTHLVDESDPPL
jgi:hypothetical protein